MSNIVWDSEKGWHDGQPARTEVDAEGRIHNMPVAPLCYGSTGALEGIPVHSPAPMIFAGWGAYPYDCIAKDRAPNAPVYIGCEQGCTGWMALDHKG